MTEATWVNFKVFGLMGLTLVFALANAPFMAKHMQRKIAIPPQTDEWLHTFSNKSQDL